MVMTPSSSFTATALVKGRSLFSSRGSGGRTRMTTEMYPVSPLRRPRVDARRVAPPAVPVSVEATLCWSDRGDATDDWPSAPPGVALTSMVACAVARGVRGVAVWFE